MKNLSIKIFQSEVCAAMRPKPPLIASEKPVPGFLLAVPLWRAAKEEE